MVRTREGDPDGGDVIVLKIMEMEHLSLIKDKSLQDLFF